MHQVSRVSTRTWSTLWQVSRSGLDGGRVLVLSSLHTGLRLAGDLQWSVVTVILFCCGERETTGIIDLMYSHLNRYLY